MKKCSVCGIEIPAGRLKILPYTKTCVNHSETSRYVGNIISHGDVEAGESFQEFEVIRDKETANQFHHYKSRLGSYK